MKKISALRTSLAAALALSFGVCVSAQAEDTAREGAHAHKAADAGAMHEDATPSGKADRNTQASAMGGDGEALGMLQAINAHEIAAARLAKEKDVSAPVMQYADMLAKEHTANESKTRQVGDDAGVDVAETKDVEAMKAKSKTEREMLAAKDGKAFETAYVDAMAKGHAEALAKIDDVLLPAARDAKVKRHLTETRGHIAMHLEEARALQGNTAAKR